jgi:hypothetical protein
MSARTAVLATLFSIAALPASAATVYNLSAVSKTPAVSNFSLTFEDFDSDMLFSVDELISFSGVTVFFGSVDVLYPILGGVPIVESYTDGGIAGCGISLSGRWIFCIENGSGYIPEPTQFTYSTTVVPTAAVPLPAGLPLVLTGLAGFLGLRMRKKRKV